MSQVHLVLDFETRSKADLRKIGATEYARHPSTQLLCVAWRIGTLEDLREQMKNREKVPAKRWSPAIPSPYGEFKRALLDPSVMLVAHNAPFEQAITRYVLSKLISDPALGEIPIERWLCTMAAARAVAVPAKLEGACAALHLPVQKDMEGHRLMMKMSKPRKPTKNNPAIWHQKKADLVRLMEYCATDVDAETMLLLTLPPLPESEREVWKLDQKINQRGFLADRDLVNKILGMISEEMKRFESETRRITDGLVNSTAQRDATLRFLASNGCSLPNLQKKTVEDALAARLATGKALELLLLRQAASKSSTAKYEAFENRSRSSGRVYDNLTYHTAGTGRWGGAGVQPQNFPARGIINKEDLDFACKWLADPEVTLEDVRLIWGNPLDFFASLLRSMIKASPGKELFSGDFAGIEARVLFWLARHEEGLRAFRNGDDLYCELASEIFGFTVTKKENPKERDLGKRAILGCGFGMGKAKFFETCKNQGQEVEPELAAAAVAAYRKKHYPVVHLWSNLDKAAIAAVKNPGKRYSVNRTKWFFEKKFLWCQLPSGRKLAFYGPEIRKKPTPWGEMKETLYHWDIHPKTKKWVFTGTYGGKLAENVTQGVARDLMAAAMIRVEKAGYEVLFSVHDEADAERAIGEREASDFEKLMAQSPVWAEGIPIVVEGWKGPRYRK